MTVWNSGRPLAAKLGIKQATDATEDVVRDVVLARQLVDIKVAAIDTIWSGLKVAWRREARR